MSASHLLFLSLLLAIPAAAQPSTVQLSGRVLDPTRAPIAGARISASPSQSSVTNAEGEFALSLLPGEYTLNLSAEGFRPAEQALTIPSAGLVREFTLEIAAVHQALTINESAGYTVPAVSSSTRTLTPLRDVPQAISVVAREQMRDQLMMSIADVVRYVPGITAHQGENNRDQVIIRGNSSSADFFVNGMRDDVQYYRDLYNLERVEALKGPNAMAFGRGGGGGVINRVTKEAGSAAFREVTLQGGSYGNKRATIDLAQPLNSRVALRLNSVYENSGSFRDYVNLERFGIAPAITISLGPNTRATASYEHFRDNRVADRGVPSYQLRPLAVPVSTYFGDPNDSRAFAHVHLGSASVEHQAGIWNIRNRAQFAGYDRAYHNYVPGAVSADGSTVSLSAYDNATARLNIFDQTDVTRTLHTGRIRHMLLAGAELGRQLTDNFRNTGYFNSTSTSITIRLSQTVISTPAAFRQSATDADNHITTNVAATYVQDQIQLTGRLQAVAGVRFDHFDLRYRNNRTAEELRRIDNMASPRAGLVFRAADPLSLYASYGVSYLPSSGDQFSSLTTVTQQVKPEKFSNYEFGAKWELRRGLSATAAVYRLDRTNTRSTDPNDPTRIIQTGSQRTNGFELGSTGTLTRRWTVSGGYAWQDAFISAATTSAAAGARVAQVPHHTFSFWNNYQALRRAGLGLGLTNRSSMFTAIDNTVVLPGYARVDMAVFLSLTESLRLQANVENLFDRRYYDNANGNNNISPGSPRAFRLALTARF